MILDPAKIKSATVSTVSPSICHEAREFQKNIYFCFIVYAKALDCVDHKKLWKILKQMDYQTTWPGSWEICMQLKEQQLELDIEQ